jgi:hypothetical protein
MDAVVLGSIITVGLTVVVLGVALYYVINHINHAPKSKD